MMAMTQRSSVRVMPSSLFRIFFIVSLPATRIMLLVTHKTRETGKSFEILLRPRPPKQPCWMGSVYSLYCTKWPHPWTQTPP